MDAFTTSWSGELNYAFPPTRKVDHVLRKMRADSAKGVLIAFEWRGAPWFPMIFPNGRQGKPAAFVKGVWALGQAERLLLFPKATTPQQQTSSLPHGSMLALRLNFQSGSSR